MGSPILQYSQSHREVGQAVSGLLGSARPGLDHSGFSDQGHEGLELGFQLRRPLPQRVLVWPHRHGLRELPADLRYVGSGGRYRSPFKRASSPIVGRVGRGGVEPSQLSRRFYRPLGSPHALCRPMRLLLREAQQQWYRHARHVGITSSASLSAPTSPRARWDRRPAPSASQPRSLRSEEIPPWPNRAGGGAGGSATPPPVPQLPCAAGRARRCAAPPL